MIISLRDYWSKGRQRHADYFDTKLNLKLADHKWWAGKPGALRAFIVQHRHEIRDGNVKALCNIQKDFDQLLDAQGMTPPEIDAIRDWLKRLFDYPAFRDGDGSWGAHALCATAEETTCPYCNLYPCITVPHGDEGLLRPDLDHYLDRATYPMFGLSLGNLVVSCVFCNSRLKHTHDFGRYPHLHPMEDEERIGFWLDVNPLAAYYDVKKLDNASIRLSFAEPHDIRMYLSARTFKIHKRYQSETTKKQARRVMRGLIEFYQTKNRMHALTEESREGFKDSITEGANPQTYRAVCGGRMILDLHDQCLANKPLRQNRLPDLAIEIRR